MNCSASIHINKLEESLVEWSTSLSRGEKWLNFFCIENIHLLLQNRNEILKSETEEFIILFLV